MQFSSLFFVAVFAVSIARCAPVLNSSTFSDNAKQAQELNAKFLNLKATDQCQVGETACIGGNIVKCDNSKFEISEQCLDDQECFAIPNIQNPGTSLDCTTERNVLGLIKAANIDEDATGSGNNSTSTSSTSSSTSSTSSNTSSTSSNTSTTSLTSSTGRPSDISEPPNRNPGNNKPGDSVVTVTVTQFAVPQSTTTTAALSPNLTSSSSDNLLLPPATSSSSVPPLTRAADPGSTPAPSAPSVIILSVAGGGATNLSPSPTSPSPIQLSAVAEGPTPSSPTPALGPSGPPNVPVGGGGGGGGYY